MSRSWWPLTRRCKTVKTDDDGPKTEEQPAAPPILETQLALVPDGAAVPDESSVADETSAAEEAPIEPSAGEEPPPVADVNELAEGLSPPVEVNEAAPTDPIESTNPNENATS